MEAADSSETLEPIHQNIKHHASQDHNFNWKKTAIICDLFLLRLSIIMGSKMYLTTYVKVNLE
jgi:hypothetical protein